MGAGVEVGIGVAVGEGMAVAAGAVVGAGAAVAAGALVGLGVAVAADPQARTKIRSSATEVRIIAFEFLSQW